MRKFKTCQVCSRISEYCDELDGKPICGACLDERLNGSNRRECASRGYHETATASGYGPRELGNTRAEFRLDITCRCGASGVWVEVVEATPIEERSWMKGYLVPNGPKHWVKVEGVVTPLSEENIKELTKGK